MAMGVIIGVNAVYLSLFELISNILFKYIHYFAFHRRRYVGCELGAL